MKTSLLFLLVIVLQPHYSAAFLTGEGPTKTQRICPCSKKKMQVGKSYFVTSKKEYARNDPDAKAEVIAPVFCGYVVTIVEPVKHKWVRIQYRISDISFKGYIRCTALSEDPVACPPSK